MPPTTSLFPLLLPLALLLAYAHASAIPRDSSTAVALASGYTDDNCDYPPFGDYVLDFEPSSVGQCVGNGTVAKGVFVEQLSGGCVVNAYTYADCTGEHYQLNAVGCWVDFVVEDEDLGVQGLSVTCDGATVPPSSSGAVASDTASASGTASASETASASDTGSSSDSASASDTASASACASASASATDTDRMMW